MTTEKQNIGQLGENIAVKYLEKHGYKILDEIIVNHGVKLI